MASEISLPPPETLWLDGCPTGLVVRRAESWPSRALGVWSDPRWVRGAVLLIPGCRAIHTSGLRRALDVVFTDESGRIIAIDASVPPWSVRSEPAACATWEAAAGTMSKIGALPGARLSARRMRGATMVEFMLAAMLVVLPTTFLALELARLVVSRHALQHAVNDTAREAGFTLRSGAEIRRSVAFGLMPLFVRTDPAAALAAGTPSPRGGPSAERGLAALTMAYAETFRPDLLEVSLESIDGGSIGLAFQTIAWPEAGGAWRLRIRYCRELVFPLARQIIPELVRWHADSLFDQACLARERLPLEAWAVVLRPGWAPRPAPGEPPVPPADDRVLPPHPAPDPPTSPVPAPLPTPTPSPDERLTSDQSWLGG